MAEETDKKSRHEVVYKPTTQNEPTDELLKVEKQSKSNCFLYTAASVANLIAFTAGISFAWTSPVIPQLNGSIDPENNPIGRPITPSEESWIAGMLPLGSALGPVVAGRTADKIGRKRTLLILAVPMAISFFMTAYGNSVPIFYIARLFIGFGAGSVFAVLPMYLGEIAEDHNRGTLGCLMGVFVAAGLLYSFVIGPFMTVRNFSLLCLAPLTIFLPVFFVLIPESPVFLASISDQYGLEDTLKKLRNKSETQIEKEVASLLKSAQENNEIKGGIELLFKVKGLRKGLIVSVGLITLQQFSGINAVIAYMQSIFDATGSGMAPATSAIIIGAVQVVATIITSSIVDSLGRRILLLISSTGCCISLVCLGAYFYLQTNKFDVTSISWLPIGSLLVYIIAFNAGLGPLVWAVMAELFPANVKSTASSLTSFACFVASFIITLFFPSFALMLGMANSFWLFAIFCLLGSLFIYWVVPETKGKTLQDIQELLGSSKV